MDMVHPMRIGYMGIPLSNSEEAATLFAERNGWTDCELVPLMDSAGVVEALVAKKIDYGVVASHNITAGPVEETEKALKKHNNIETVQTETVPIHHCVFVKNNTCITAIASHIQALLQTRENLSRLYPGAEMIEVEDTAYAAKELSENILPDNVAVICRKNAGIAFGLILAHENIEDRKDNMTSFSLLRIKT